LVLAISVLHNHLNTMGYKTIHGIMPITYPRATAEAIESLKMVYLGTLRYEIAPDVMNRFGTASGVSRWKFINPIQFVRFLQLLTVLTKSYLLRI
jgi:hypothetical protein